MVIVKRTTKYPERIMNSSKSSISLMICGSASGTMLPPYVVYKAENLYNTWTLGEPKGTRYNRSTSEWFDLDIFEDWFERLFLPSVRHLEGRKILIGDNVSPENIKLGFRATGIWPLSRSKVLEKLSLENNQNVDGMVSEVFIAHLKEM